MSNAMRVVAPADSKQISTMPAVIVNGRFNENSVSHMVRVFQ